MKKIILFIALIAATNMATAQQKYYVFEIEGKKGITDVAGKEAIKPIYGFTSYIASKSEIYLRDYSDRPDVIFNAETGAKQNYERIYDNVVEIKNVPYSLITNKGKKYFLSEETNKTINLTGDYSDFKNVGQYIIAEFYPTSPPAKSIADKNGIPMPPKILPPPTKHLAVLTNNETLKRIMKTNFISYISLNKVPGEERDENDRVLKVEVIDLAALNKPQAKFDYILFSKGNNHSLYNSKMVLVKTFVLAKPDENSLVEASEKIVKHKLENAQSYGDFKSAPTMDMAVPNGPSTGSSEPKKVEKKPFKPFFYIKELENGNTLFALQETEEISNHIFEAKKGMDIYLNKDEYTIRMKGKKNSKFSFDPKTGTIYLPKIYLTQLGITII